MGTLQQICLKWKNHQPNFPSAFELLLKKNDLIDVTIACEQQTIKAHKVVLSACSPVFHSLFMDNPCQHPIVILQDAKFSDIQAIVEFMYKGEVNVAQEQLTTFIKAAEALQVKGLTEENDMSPQSKSHEECYNSSSPIPKNNTVSDEPISFDNTNNRVEYDPENFSYDSMLKASHSSLTRKEITQQSRLHIEDTSIPSKQMRLTPGTKNKQQLNKHKNSKSPSKKPSGAVYSTPSGNIDSNKASSITTKNEPLPHMVKVEQQDMEHTSNDSFLNDDGYNDNESDENQLLTGLLDAPADHDQIISGNEESSQQTKEENSKDQSEWSDDTGQEDTSGTRNHVTLPQFSDYVVEMLNQGQVDMVWDRVVEEAAQHVLSTGLFSKHDYFQYGQLMYKAYPCIGLQNNGAHHWSTFNKRVSQKVRNIRWKRNQNSRLLW